MQKILQIINLKTLIVSILSVVSTWLSIKLEISDIRSPCAIFNCAGEPVQYSRTP
ncbi:MAG: hypothetical protein ACI9MF_001075 [Gammaproteobacteria bacterium]|jgi:hypothetical protein